MVCMLAAYEGISVVDSSKCRVAGLTFGIAAEIAGSRTSHAPGSEDMMPGP